MHGVAVMVVFGRVAGTHYVQRRLQIVVLLQKFHRLVDEFQPGESAGGSSASSRRRQRLFFSDSCFTAPVKICGLSLHFNLLMGL